MNKPKPEKSNQAPFDWESVRRINGTFDLIRARENILGLKPGVWREEDEGAVTYLLTVEALQPIISRQAAAIAVATAMGMKSKKK